MLFLLEEMMMIRIRSPCFLLRNIKNSSFFMQENQKQGEEKC